jgi:hypothetical protein
MQRSPATLRITEDFVSAFLEASMTRDYLVLLSRNLASVAIGLSAALYSLTAPAQQGGSTPRPPTPHADDSDDDEERDNSRSSRQRDDSDDDSDRSPSSSRDTARDSNRESNRDDRSSRDSRARDSRSSRSYSRDTDDDRSAKGDRDRDNDGDADDRASARDRSSSRDRTDRSTSRDRIRDDVRDTARDTRDAVRNAASDVRNTARNVRDNVAGRNSVPDFDPNSTRAADVGLWFNRSTNNGLLISDVASSGPISQLGFREGDRIVSIDGNQVANERQFMQDLFYDDIRNNRVPVVINRNGAQRTIYVQPSTLVDHYSTAQNDPLEQFGLVLDDRYRDRLVVWKTIPRTPAYYAGVRAGDVVTAVDNTRVSHHEDLTHAVQQAENAGNREIQLTVFRGQQQRHLEAEVANLASSDQRTTSYRPTYEDNTGYAPRTIETQPRTTLPARPLRPGILPRNR